MQGQPKSSMDLIDMPDSAEDVRNWFLINWGGARLAWVCNTAVLKCPECLRQSSFRLGLRGFDGMQSQRGREKERERERERKK